MVKAWIKQSEHASEGGAFDKSKRLQIVNYKIGEGFLSLLLFQRLTAILVLFRLEREFAETSLFEWLSKSKNIEFIENYI